MTGARDEAQSQTLWEMFGEPVGDSFDSNEASENLSDTSDFEIAECDLSSKIMCAIKYTAVMDTQNEAPATPVNDQFDFSTEVDDSKEVPNDKKFF